MINLAAGKCAACRGGEPSLTEAEIAELHAQVPECQVVKWGSADTPSNDMEWMYDSTAKTTFFTAKERRARRNLTKREDIQ
jgi:hypothetical protein